MTASKWIAPFCTSLALASTPATADLPAPSVLDGLNKSAADLAVLLELATPLLNAAPVAQKSTYDFKALLNSQNPEKINHAVRCNLAQGVSAAGIEAIYDKDDTSDVLPARVTIANAFMAAANRSCGFSQDLPLITPLTSERAAIVTDQNATGSVVAVFENYTRLLKTYSPEAVNSFPPGGEIENSNANIYARTEACTHAFLISKLPILMNIDGAITATPQGQSVFKNRLGAVNKLLQTANKVCGFSVPLQPLTAQSLKPAKPRSCPPPKGSLYI